MNPASSDHGRGVQPHLRGRQCRPSVCWVGRQSLVLPPADPHAGELEDTTGCGNTVDSPTPQHHIRRGFAAVLGKRIGIDGFRFDLAVSLARLKACSPHTIRSCTHCVPTSCSATSSSSWSRGIWASKGGAPASSSRPSESGTTDSATPPASSGSPTSTRLRAMV